MDDRIRKSKELYHDCNKRKDCPFYHRAWDWYESGCSLGGEEDCELTDRQIELIDAIVRGVFDCEHCINWGASFCPMCNGRIPQNCPIGFACTRWRGNNCEERKEEA